MRAFSGRRGSRVALGVFVAIYSGVMVFACGGPKREHGNEAAKGASQATPAPPAVTTPADQAGASAGETPVTTASAQAAAGAGSLPASAPSELKNVLHWKTKWETLNKGFLVYRGDSEKGPFRVLTPKPLPGAGSANVTHEYSFEDTTIEAGREYFYYVVAINHNDQQIKVTPVQRAAPK